MFGNLGIIIFSNAPWCGSGYGTQAAFFMRMFSKYGIKHHVACQYGLRGGMQKTAEGVTFYPMRNDPQGTDIMPRIMHHSGCNTLLIVPDIFMFPDLVESKLWTSIPFCLSDTNPVPDETVNAIKPANGHILCQSYDMVDDLTNNRKLDVQYAISGTDSTVYNMMDKQMCRKMLGFAEDDFVISIVAANQLGNRKRIPEQLSAIREFKRYVESAEGNSDKIKVYLHTDLTGVKAGMDLGRVIHDLEYPDGSVVSCDPSAYPEFYPVEIMKTIYNASDLLTNTASEGFGLCLVESLMCGTPAVTVNYAGCRDHIVDGKNGFLVRASSFEYLHNGGRHAYPDQKDLVQRYYDAYKGRIGWSREEIRANAIEKYEDDNVFRKYWIPFLDSLSIKKKITEGIKV